MEQWAHVLSSSLLMEHSVPFRVHKTERETEREKATKREIKNGEKECQAK